MLQQTQVKTVLPYWNRWMQTLPHVQTLAEASSRQIHKLWEGLGYYSRVRNLHKAAQKIVANHGGKIPENYADLIALPGIGRYTAGAICSIAFDQPQPILDGNVIRVLTRLFAIGGDPREAKVNAELWRVSGKLVLWAAKLGSAGGRALRVKDDQSGHGFRANCNGARRYCSEFNQSLMELGAMVCTPKLPKCSICPVSHYCAAYRKGKVDQFPNLRTRPDATPRRFIAIVVQKRGRFLVQQRPAGVVNAHLWEFPNIEIASDISDRIRAAGRLLGSRSASLERIGTIKHSITRYRITVEVFRAAVRVEGRASRRNGKWLTRRELDRLPFTSAHARIRDQLLDY